MKKKLLSVFFLFSVGFLLTDPSIVSGQFFAFLEDDIVGKPAPDFTLKTPSGETLHFQQARQGQKALVFFWATWCPTCHGELKRLNADIDLYHQQKIKIFAVNLEGKAAEVAEYIQQNKLNNLTFVLDEESSLIDPYALIGVPSIFFINEAGIVTSLVHALPGNLAEAFRGPTDQGKEDSKAPAAMVEKKSEDKDSPIVKKVLSFSISIFLFIWIIFAPLLMIRRLNKMISVLENKTIK
jgi:peroxiredoxin